MVKKILLFTLLTSLVLNAQKKNIEKVTITGTVLETTTKQPLEYATFVLTNLKSKNVLGGVTNSKGNFSLKIPKGIYAVKIEFIGFETKNISEKKLFQDTDLGTFFLSEDTETLDEIEIVAEKSTVEIKLDKKVFNVGKDLSLKGGNASNVLDNVPSVSVDSEGAVSLRGNENVRILIDGKPSALVGLNSTDALKNLPADAIERVEVITSPSARYDAEGTAGILNIILRKGKITGFNGSIGITAGNPDLLNIAPSLNYRTKKVNLFTNLGYSYRNGPGSAIYKTRYLDENLQPTSYLYQDRDFQRKNNNYNISLGLEYFINDKSSITSTFVYQNSDDNVFSNNVISSGINIDTIEFDSTRDTYEDKFGETKQYALNYANNFNEEGHKLTADLQFSESSVDEITEIFEDDIFISNVDEFTDSKNFLFQIDYVLPLKEKSQLELGHKVDFEDLNTNFTTTNDDNDFTEQVLNFEQTIYSYYAQYGNKSKKISYLLGLRAETTKADIQLEGIDGITSLKDYTSLFPTINIGYEIDENDNIVLGYNRRVRRPRSRELNPFPSQSSSTFIFQGNPDLDPTFTNSIDLGYNTKIKKLNLGASVYYQSSTNPISRATRIIGDGTVEVRQTINLDSETRYGFETNANYKPNKWLRLSASFNFFNYKTDEFTFFYLEDGIEDSIFLEEVNSSSWFARFTSNITLPAKIQWQTRLMYRGAQETAQSDRKGILSTNLAFSKDILKEKASLTLNVNDLFNTRKFNLVNYNENRENPESITDLTFQRRVRQINLNFTYRFNQKKKREKNSRGRNNDNGDISF